MIGVIGSNMVMNACVCLGMILSQIWWGHIKLRRVYGYAGRAVEFVQLAFEKVDLRNELMGQSSTEAISTRKLMMQAASSSQARRGCLTLTNALANVVLTLRAKIDPETSPGVKLLLVILSVNAADGLFQS